VDLPLELVAQAPEAGEAGQRVAARPALERELELGHAAALLLEQSLEACLTPFPSAHDHLIGRLEAGLACQSVQMDELWMILQV